MNCTNCVNATCTSGSTTSTLGWTSAPNCRGTLDIIWSCALTLFLCCWSVLVVNVPLADSPSWQLLRNKLCLVGLYAMAPELVFQVALGQWLSARRSITLFHQLNDANCKKWTISHGFYADMGGFRFQPAGWKSFPINAKQLHYLVAKKYVRLPDLEEIHIHDKNKVDGMLRLITLVQTLWFVLDVVMRATQHLTVTALELSTVAFVWLGIATSICWMAKPADVEYADTIKSDASMEDILREAGETANGAYYYTPMDFASRAEWSWSRLWNHGLNLLRRLHWAAPPAERPIPRIQNTLIPEIDGWFYVMWVVVSIVYFAIFLVGWNFTFPTKTEQTLWQTASVMALGTALTICFALNWCCSWWPKLKTKLKRCPTAGVVESQQEQRHEPPRQQPRWVRALLAHFRNNSIMRDPAFDTPATLIVVTWIFGILYAASRAYIVVADIIELRSLPASAYKTVEWSALWPHF